MLVPCPLNHRPADLSSLPAATRRTASDRPNTTVCLGFGAFPSVPFHLPKILPFLQASPPMHHHDQRSRHAGTVACYPHRLPPRHRTASDRPNAAVCLGSRAGSPWQRNVQLPAPWLRHGALLGPGAQLLAGVCRYLAGHRAKECAGTSSRNSGYVMRRARAPVRPRGPGVCQRRGVRARC